MLKIDKIDITVITYALEYCIENTRDDGRYIITDTDMRKTAKTTLEYLKKGVSKI